jgi:hypothetical protein
MNENGVPFRYALDPVVLAGNGVAQSQVQILDNPFKCNFLMASSTGRFLAQIFDGATKRPFSNVQVVDTLQFGTAQNPFPLLQPYVFGRRGQIMVQFTDISGAGNTIRVVFDGVELLNA